MIDFLSECSLIFTRTFEACWENDFFRFLIAFLVFQVLLAFFQMLLKRTRKL